MKKRLDVLLVERGLATSREKAKAMIMAGEVLVDHEREDKAGSMFPEEVEIVLKGKPLPYVSRGGLKLEKAMKNFDLTLEGKVCMDVGASTGGFTDCMLQNGAVKVYSVDVGHGQLDWKLRNDPRVVCMERTNIRYVVPEDIEERPSFVSIDVSFISLTKVLLPIRNYLTPEGEILTLQADELHMGYRTSVVKEAGYIVLEAVLSLAKGDPEAIRSRMQELAGMRSSKQPLSYPSAGSTFKRPEGYFAGKLIMDSGLRGYQVGGAQVSEKQG